MAAASRDPPLDADKPHEAERACGQAHPRPGWPTLFVAEHQRQHDKQHGRHDDGEPLQIEAPVRRAHVVRGLRDVAGNENGEHRADRHVHQEDRSPGQAEHVRRHEKPAADLPDRGSQRERRGVKAERAQPRRAGELALNDAEQLRNHRRRARALHKSCGDKQPGVRRQAANQRRRGEGDQSELEKRLGSAHVSEPRASDEQHRVGDGVARDHQLQRGARRVQIGLHGRQRDVDDGDVDQGHELADHHQRQGDPALPVAWRRCSDDGARLRGAGHESSLRELAHCY